jgi:hypothetical protein
MNISNIKIFIIAISCLLSTLTAWAKSPCDGIDRRLNLSEIPKLRIEVGHQLNVDNVEILQSFKSLSWTILYAASDEADPVFLFYSDNPVNHHLITLWSGGAKPDEEQAISSWLQENAKDIPSNLAQCFVWHVTKDRDM